VNTRVDREVGIVVDRYSCMVYGIWCNGTERRRLPPEEKRGGIGSGGGWTVQIRFTVGQHMHRWGLWARG